MKLTCICCKGERYVMVTDAEYPDDPPQRQACCYCGATGAVKLTVSEAETYAIGQEQNKPADGQPETLPWRENDEGHIIYDRD